jgi:putative acyl-CoA dehydrogenase
MLALGIRIAAAFDSAGTNEDEAVYARLLTPVAKLWVCKAVPQFVYEALESLGGNGYVEEWPLARLYREAPLNAIWEGSGNIMALDLLRGAERERDGMDRLLSSIETASRDLPGASAATERVRQGLHGSNREMLARQTGETLALVAAATALKASAPSSIAEAFAQNRLGGLPGRNYGAPIPPEFARLLLERSLAAEA